MASLHPFCVQTVPETTTFRARMTVMLHSVPFAGSGWKVTYLDHQAALIGDRREHHQLTVRSAAAFHWATKASLPARASTRHAATATPGPPVGQGALILAAEPLLQPSDDGPTDAQNPACVLEWRLRWAAIGNRTPWEMRNSWRSGTWESTRWAWPPRRVHSFGPSYALRIPSFRLTLKAKSD